MVYLTKTITSFCNATDDYLAIGASPALEDCFPAGSELFRAKQMCIIYIQQLLRGYGSTPEKCSYFILKNHHEFGNYYEAAIRFGPTDASAAAYAYKVKAGSDEWDDESRAKLLELNLPFKAV